MKTNKNAVQAKINSLSKGLNVKVNVLLATYFFDAFLLRLSKSEYSEDFIFKGGFYLSAIMGIQNRYTKDLDFKLTGQDLEERNLTEIIKEIISISTDDEITFEFISITPIRDEDQYGGFTVSLQGHLENIKQTVNLDIATGDPITPDAVIYKYKRRLEGDILNFKAYNLETVLAEKIQTVYNRGLLNSRSKDFYDIYIIHKLKWNEINVSDFKEAYRKTCEYRQTVFTKDAAVDVLSRLRKDEQIRLRWLNYVNKNDFASGIDFNDVMKSCESITEILYE